MRKYKYLILTILLAVGLSACQSIPYINNDENGSLSGSGTIASMEVRIAPEISGAVKEIVIEEGDEVEEGDVLFLLDDVLLQAQHAQVVSVQDTAETALTAAQKQLESAKVQLEMAQYASRMEEEPILEGIWGMNLPNEFSLPVWYFTQQEKIQSAEYQVSITAENLETEIDNLNRLLENSGNAEIIAIEERLANARAAFLVAEAAWDQAKTAKDREGLDDFAESQYESAKTELEAAQSEYDRLLTETGAEDLQDARSRVAVAKRSYDLAISNRNVLLTGEESLRVKAASSGVEQAEAGVGYAEAVLGQAQAALDGLDLQLEKVVVYSPMSGVVQARNLEKGEIVMAGSVSIVVGKLDPVKLTVYIPEDRYGEIYLGQTVIVTVDSFPGLEFEGSVVRIADKAQFTPRNVQTVDGRKSTVYAIDIELENPEYHLKPGMPADATFVER